MHAQRGAMHAQGGAMHARFRDTQVRVGAMHLLAACMHGEPLTSEISPCIVEKDLVVSPVGGVAVLESSPPI